jgi:hypothetical protein
MTNSYTDMIIYIDNIINLELTTYFVITIYLTWKGANKLWKRILD